ncbi:MAG: DUF4160 domain-containing protein [Spirochaetaceae bacterium]|jgi:hypothetical protein|nr:DUF4160 domain-containing protein [Spirochaetaceae bacterium]
MGAFVKGDVVVFPFPYSDLSSAKRRPALIVCDLPGDDIIACLLYSYASFYLKCKKWLTKKYELAYYINMPELSRFLGMIVSIYFDDHNPPHFHVLYNEHEALIAINDFTVLKGSLPSRVLGLAIEWANLHKKELMDNWNIVQKDGKFFKIEPLV